MFRFRKNEPPETSQFEFDFNSSDAPEPMKLGHLKSGLSKLEGVSPEQTRVILRGAAGETVVSEKPLSTPIGPRSGIVALVFQETGITFEHPKN